LSVGQNSEVDSKSVGGAVCSRAHDSEVPEDPETARRPYGTVGGIRRTNEPIRRSVSLRETEKPQERRDLRVDPTL
jgi:hypothetical protein